MTAIRQLRSESKYKRAVLSASNYSPKRSLKVKISGYDPRFDATAKLFSSNVFDSTRYIKSFDNNLDSSYLDFINRFESGGNYQVDQDIVIVDIPLVPQYLRENKIIDINSISPHIKSDFEALLETHSKINNYGYDLRVAKLIRMLCSDRNGKIGCLPVWGNAHGRYIAPNMKNLPIYQDLRTCNSIDSIIRHKKSAEVLFRGSVQTIAAASLFTFWAHLAYRGARLFITNYESKTVHADLLKDDCSEDYNRFLEAVADYGVRILTSQYSRKLIDRAKSESGSIAELFDMDGDCHEDEVQVLKVGHADWSPAFSSELLARLSDIHDRNYQYNLLVSTDNFKIPFCNRSSAKAKYQYLSSLGGYGMAINSCCTNKEYAYRAMKFLFFINKYIMHPNLISMLPPKMSSLDDFFELHTRPRWPFWRKVERPIVDMLIKLVSELEELEKADPIILREKAIEKLKHSETTRKAVLNMLDSVMKISIDSGWKFVITLPQKHNQ